MRNYDLFSSNGINKPLFGKQYNDHSLTINDDRVIAEALSLWERETNLKFVRSSSGKVHIEIRFEKGRHGDEDDFDGRGGTLAHAFFPIYGGDVHFDDDERWTDNFDSGTNLLMTASHELGHSLGLAHSDVRGSVMSPFYTPYKNGLRLHKDDIEGIQALYGGKSVKRYKTISIKVVVKLVLMFSESQPRPRKNPSSQEQAEA